MFELIYELCLVFINFVLFNIKVFIDNIYDVVVVCYGICGFLWYIVLFVGYVVLLRMIRGMGI